MNTLNKMESNLTGLWVSFFTAAGIPSEVAATYALTFTENRIQNDMLLDLNKEYLRDMGIVRMGDIIAILRHAKQVHENTARDRVLNTAVTAVSAKVPVAAITGRSTVSQPASPASRMLEHYTRNTQTKETSPIRPVQQKRKSAEEKPDQMSIKKARLIRFGSPPKTAAKEAPTNKNVFARLGNSEPVKVTQSIPSPKPAKQIFTRLGNKDSESETESQILMQKDALKYEGILKSPPVVKKSFTITTTSNNARKIAIGCTMRADEQPVSVRDKLYAKNKSVKFANHVEYKEIETPKKIIAGTSKITQVFNKPERRLSMPEVPSSVKSRLGMKNQDKNIVVEKNIFKRLGV